MRKYTYIESSQREDIVEFSDRGYSAQLLADVYNISVSTVYRILQKQRRLKLSETTNLLDVK
jgi:DNA invertase Pin-like site-specific DNA recombinase